MLLLTDGRFSGGTTGLCIGHVAPEAVDGGPIAFVKDGDRIRVDIAARTFDLLVEESELEARKIGWEPLPAKFTKGVLAKYAKLVHSASTGATAADWRILTLTMRRCRRIVRRPGIPLTESCRQCGRRVRMN
ncbi:dihydroxy-acid dehydratase [Arthrobacter sp. Hiyo6]|nr:dihydroxy-acid dehydratase [Arthrobacter sp. Hiyo6]